MENLDNVILFKKKINPKKIPIHPLIEELDISNKVKRYFNKLEFYEIIEDYIVFSDKLKEIDEARANCWSFKVELKFCEINDIKAFYLAIISARRKFLVDIKYNQKMIFYTWYDDMSGNFYFSLIPINWTKLPEGKELPFGCIINKVEFLDDIIEEFVNDPYKGVIPISSLVDVDPLEKDDEEYVENTHVRNIWSIIL